MPLHVIQGPPNSGRAGEVLARFRAALEREPVLVVPTVDDVAAFERELCAGGTASIGGSITTFGAVFAEVARALAVDLPPSLTAAQRQALIRAAVGRAKPRRLHRSAARPGFVPALDALIGELQAALISPTQFASDLAALDDADHERELAAMYAAYVELRDAAGRADEGLRAERVIAALRTATGLWRGRPVFVYGFDDLTRAQVELVDALARAAEVTVAVSYDDRRALAPRAGLLQILRDDLAAESSTELVPDEAYSTSPVLRHLDRNLFEHGAPTLEPDEGLVLLASAGARGEAEAIGIETARLLTAGYEPDQVAVVLRHPDSTGPLLASVLTGLGLPVALEASIPLSATCVGGSLISLCRAALDEAAVEDLLAHLRSDPSLPPAAVDWVERRIRRGEAQTVSAATGGWEHPPRHVARLLEAGDGPGALRALARSARELAEGPHRGRAPLASGRAGIAANGGGPPFSALELRAGAAAAELLDELAGIGELPGCEPPGIRDALEAIESATVACWRGPATGRVRIIGPYRARTARVRALFCASLGDGEFPSAVPPDPLLSEERRRQLGNPDLRRAEPAAEERYLFHACVSRPTERLYLSWQSSDEDGTAAGRSPFIDEVCDLLGPDPEAAEQRVLRPRGPERSVPGPDEATTERGLARALALAGPAADRVSALRRLGVREEDAAATLALFYGLPDPCALPGPLSSPRVLDELGARRVFSAGQLEGWLECPYRWFVDHELAPQRLEPEADPLWLGGVVHTALERLYGEPPGDDAIPRRDDLDRWRRRLGELMTAVATERAGAPLNQARRSALDRARVQVEAFLAAEAESDTELRPRHLELAFGPMDDAADREAQRPPLRIGEIELRGRIDRIDVAADGRTAVVRDYKTAKSVARAAEFADRGTLQIQLYMRAAGRLLDLDPAAGIYHPLGAAKPEHRRPRGIARRDDPCLDDLDLVRNDRVDPDEVERALADAERLAAEAADEIRAGRIDRLPIGGSCPDYCTYQPICRLERAIGAVGEESQNGSEE
jgi:ATP-dependent helicase/DNAse subunit B